MILGNMFLIEFGNSGKVIIATLLAIGIIITIISAISSGGSNE